MERGTALIVAGRPHDAPARRIGESPASAPNPPAATRVARTSHRIAARRRRTGAVHAASPPTRTRSRTHRPPHARPHTRRRP
ncbi:MAG: hypothetical protein O9972_39915 [Burkholderiales bacterium]|nr:hypothetical protein [Burkholderiales bacterium]